MYICQLEPSNPLFCVAAVLHYIFFLIFMVLCLLLLLLNVEYFVTKDLQTQNTNNNDLS
eukprot:m.72966 g.72966  ORF g.72966 m.72966 type:complete len:59 (+) comp13876_c2_seq1:1785-1961(+)